MVIPISETGVFQQNASQWSGNETIQNDPTVVPIVNELNWSVNPNSYANGTAPKSYWSPADGSDLQPVIWNDFVVVSATANFANNGTSPSTLNLKLLPNKTFFESLKTTKYYNNIFDPQNGVLHQKNQYDNTQLKAKTNSYLYIPNVGYVLEALVPVYQGNSFTNFNYKGLSVTHPRYDATSSARSDFKSPTDSTTDPNLVYSDDKPEAILSPDGLPLFLKPWYTRIGEPANFSVGQFSFGGIISSWKIVKGMDGFFYECVVTDPTEILKSVNIIVGNYKGPTGYFNAINALGFFEAVNNGLPYNANYAYNRYAQVDKTATNGTNVIFKSESNFNYNLNENISGMRISHIATCLSQLLRAPSPTFDLMFRNGNLQYPRTYGGPIVYGHRETLNWYNLDLSVFNLVKQNYFVEGSGGVVNLYDLLSTICRDAGCDMIVTLSGRQIVPKIINRNFAPGDNVIAKAIQSLSSSGNGVIDASYGYELIEQNNSGQLIIGAPKEIFYQTDAIRPVYGSYKGNPILGIPGAIKITLPSLVQFDNIGSSEPTQLGEIGTVDVQETVNTKNEDGTITKTPTGNTLTKRVGFLSKIFSVEFVKIPLPTQIANLLGPTYTTNTFEMMIVRSDNGSVVWEKYLRFAKKDIWDMLYGYGSVDDPTAQLPKDHSQTSTGVEQLYQEKMGYNLGISRDEIANRLFQVISSYAESWGKYWAVSLPDKASNIGPSLEYGINSKFKSMNLGSEYDYSAKNNPSLGDRKLHYDVKSDTYIDMNPSWNDANIFSDPAKRSTVVESSRTINNFPSGSVGSLPNYPMDMPPTALGQFLSANQTIGPVAEYKNLILKLSDRTFTTDSDTAFDKNAYGDQYTPLELAGNYLGYSGNDFLNGIYPNPTNDSLVAKGQLIDKLNFMNPDFTTEFDTIEALNSIITLRDPQTHFGITYEETFYTSSQMSGAYNDIVFSSSTMDDPIVEKLRGVIQDRDVLNDMDNPERTQNLPPDLVSHLNNIYQNFWKGKQQTYNNQGKPYIYGYFTVVEIPNYPIYGMSKKAEMQEFMMYLEGIDAGNVLGDELAILASENVFPFRIKGQPIFPSRIGVPLSLTYDRWVFRDDADAYGKSASSKYPFLGKIDIQIDDNLTPSTYGGIQNFLDAASAKIKSITPQRQSESGSITFIGLPTGSLGDYLSITGNLSSVAAASFGPALTGINVSFDAQRVSTTYEFKNFAPRFGVTSREYIERIKENGLLAQKIRMLAIKQLSEKAMISPESKAQPQYVSRYNDRQPPHEIIYFRQFELSKQKMKRITAKSGTEQEVLRDLKPMLDHVALASWDAFLAPYSSRSSYFLNPSLPYGVSAIDRKTTFNGTNYVNSSSRVDFWGSLQDPKLNIIKPNVSDVNNKITQYKYFVTLQETTGLTLPQLLAKQALEKELFDTAPLVTSINSCLLNPLPKEANVDSVLYKKDTDTVVDIRGHRGKDNARFVTSIGLKGPIVITGWGVDKHASKSGGAGPVIVGSGGLIPSIGTTNHIGNQSNFMTGPADFLWDNYRGTWSTKDSELVYVKSYDKMPSGLLGYLVDCYPINFGDGYNSKDTFQQYPIMMSGKTGTSGIIGNKTCVNIGSSGFKSFYSIKPQTGCIYTTRFLNNSLFDGSTTSSPTGVKYSQDVAPYGTCMWTIDPESTIIGYYSGGSIYDISNRKLDENIDFIHPNDHQTDSTSTIQNTLLKKASDGDIVMLKTYVGSKATYTVLQAKGGSNAVCDVQCVGNILTVTFC